MSAQDIGVLLSFDQLDVSLCVRMYISLAAAEIDYIKHVGFTLTDEDVAWTNISMNESSLVHVLYPSKL